MFDKITLKSFGLFSQRTFALKALTLFYGPNQSGKTTILDALRSELYKQHQGNSAQAKQLVARYGKNWQVELEKHSPQPVTPQHGAPPDPAMFAGLFLAQTGDFLLNLKGDWLKELRCTLFSGGVDYHALQNKLKEMLGTDKRRGLARDIANLTKRLSDAESNLSIKKAEQQDILNRQQNQAQTSQRVNALKQAIQTLEEKYKPRQERLKRQQTQQKRQQLQANLSQLQAWKTLDQQQHTALNPEKTRAALQQHKNSLQTAREEHVHACHPVPPLVMPGLQATHAFAMGGGILLLCVLVLALAFGGGLAAGGWKIGGGSAAVLGLVFLALGGWLRATQNQALQRQQDKVHEQRHEEATALAAKNEAQRNLAAFFADHQVEDEAALYQRLAAENSRAQQYKTHEDWKTKQQAQLREADDHALQARWERELNALPVEENPQPAQMLNPYTLEQTQQECDDTFRQLEAAKQDYQQFNLKQHGDSRELHGRLGKLPEEIDQLEKDRHSLKNKLDEIEEKQQAAKLASTLLAEIDQQDNDVFQQLARAVSKRYVTLSGLSELIKSAQAVELDALQNAQWKALDKQNQLRPAQHLSHGAQQLLHLALRLELAQAERHQAPALFCWDEPFAHLDASNQQRAIAMLQHTMAQQPNWQMCIFTCHQDQAEQFQHHAPQAMIHTLE